VPDAFGNSQRQFEGLAIDLLRIARGLEADAHYLRARLFRAAALGVAAEGSRTALRLGSGLEEMAEASIAELERHVTRHGLATALREALRGIAEGSTQPSGEMSVVVCQRCGEVGLGQDSGPCAACGAGPLAARRVFSAPWYDPAPITEVIAGLELTPKLVAAMCDGVDEATAQHGTWPAIDVLDHLLGAQRLIWGRAQRMLDEDEPDLGGGVPPPRASDAGETLTAAELIHTFHQERAELLGRVQDLAREDLDRGGTARPWGRTTVRQRLTYLARHEHDHLGDLAQALTEAAH
jgi:ribosomal protein L37E